MAYTTINKSTEHFNTKTWTGTGDSTTAITGVGFQPDWVWVKNRDVADDHMLFDAVRGATKRLFSNSAGAEGTDAQTLTSFDSDGFTTGTSRATGGDSGNKMVAWNWKGNGAGSSNSDGSLTSTVSVNQTAGFSIVTYTGSSSASTVGHGLNAVPKMIITKTRASGYEWAVYHEAMGNTKHLLLDTTAGMGDGEYWNDTTPTSSVFSLGGQKINVNYSGQTYVAYCFAEKTGYSKFGSYAPNGDANGNFIYLGFTPSFFLIKNTNTTRNWLIFDNKRNTSNIITKSLEPNTSDTEQTDSNLKLDFLSNGVKLRGVGGDMNTGDGVQYIYMAFAAAPLVGSNNIPCTAR